LIALAVVVAIAVPLAYQAGRRNAESRVVMTASTPLEKERIVEVPVETSKIVRVYVTRKISIPVTATKPQAEAPVKTEPAPVLKSTTTITADGANYATSSTLDGFEPLANSAPRVIKGGERK
jgi:hypothetical protein